LKGVCDKIERRKFQISFDENMQKYCKNIAKALVRRRKRKIELDLY